MLRIESLSYAYGPVRALEKVSLDVGEREVVSLLGMNGAGKSTLLSILSGLLRPDSGLIVFRNRSLVGLKPSRIVSEGVIQVPEGRQIFAPLSVRENLEMGGYLRIKNGERKAVSRDVERMLERFPVLSQRLDQPAGTLSGGEQQMLAIARGLMGRPRLLLLDEPSLGLAPKIAAEIFRVVRGLPEEGCSVLLVEQNALGALAVSQRGFILTTGTIRFSGTPQEILSDELLREAFLGPRRSEGETCPSGSGESP
ncbi:MAG: ABC transporter ATP-binding protein [Desulfovibrionales bacterium]